jgi:predicted amidohydrolase YtcJ
MQRARRYLLGALAASGFGARAGPAAAQFFRGPELIIVNARLHTQSKASDPGTALAVEGGRITMLGTDAAVVGFRTPATRVIDAGGRRLVPGLIDLDATLLTSGRHYTRTLRWDGVDSVHRALARLQQHVAGLPEGVWAIIEGGAWPAQFSEARAPTFEELNVRAGRVPVLLLLSTRRAWLNAQALARLAVPIDTAAASLGAPAIGAAEAAAESIGASIVRDREGRVAGAELLGERAVDVALAHALGAPGSASERMQSVAHCARLLARFGVTTAVDSGGALYPDDYRVLAELNARQALPLRAGCFLAAPDPATEAAAFDAWGRQPFAGQGDRWLKLLGARVRSLDPRAIEETLVMLARNRWAWRLPAADPGEAQAQVALVERVARRTSIDRLRWLLDCVDVPARETLDALRRLGGGVCMTSLAALNAERPGARASSQRALVDSGVAAGLGSGGSRRGSFNPWLAQYWLVSGRSVAGRDIEPGRPAARDALASAQEAFALATTGSAWFTEDDGVLGVLAPGRPADFAVMDADPFAGFDHRLAEVESLLTVAGGRITWASGPFAELDTMRGPLQPAWSSVGRLPPFPRGSDA